MKKLVGIIAVLLLIVIAIFGVTAFVNYHRTLVTFNGTSMEPTIHTGQVVKVHAYTKGQTPQRGDVVEYSSSKKIVLQFAKSGKLIHRIIALPGERITINNDKVLVYNAQNPHGFNPDTYIASNVVTLGSVDLTLSSGMYFVMGDNRPDALDSRAIGPIPVSDIIGKVTY